MLFAGGLRILDLPLLFGARHLAWPIGLPITVLAGRGIANAFNLIDGLDGLAAGSALFSTLVVFVVAIFNGSSLVSLLTIALAGSILGFLRFNFNPATITCRRLRPASSSDLCSVPWHWWAPEKAPTVVAVAIPPVSLRLAHTGDHDFSDASFD